MIDDVLRAVLFDLDDTLCDTIGCRPERTRLALAHLCAARPELNAEELLARALEPLPEPRTVRGLRALLQDLALLGTPLHDECARLFDTSFAPLRLFPAVGETLGWLRERYLLGVVSNAPAFQHAKLAHLRLDTLFSVVTLSGEIGIEKPDPRIFLHAIARLGVTPGEAVFVGDRLDVDVDGARRAGMRAIWFNHWGGEVTREAASPDAVITRFDTLPAALDELQRRQTGSLSVEPPASGEPRPANRGARRLPPLP